MGSPPNQRGVVCAASYEARKFKVRSAMPSRTAARLCPRGIFVQPRMDAYRAESAAIMEILRTFTPVIEKVSVDEAYLDLSANFENHDDADMALEAAAIDWHWGFDFGSATPAPVASANIVVGREPGYFAGVRVRFA